EPALPPGSAGRSALRAVPCFLCGKVLHNLGFCVSEEEIRKVVAATPGAIEPVLCAVRDKVEAGEDPPGRAGRVLQMKAARLEHLLKLKDQRIGARARDQPR
ncbi:hypothetical protein EI555_006751, partial [Monodon monoceros]